MAATLPADVDVPSTSKSFIPLENNPEVMDALTHNLGLSPKISFHDVFSIEDPELLAFVPRPAYALLLVFPISEAYEQFRTDEDGSRVSYGGSDASSNSNQPDTQESKRNDGDEDGEIMWYKQTIRNACGLIGLLHAVSNGAAKNFIDPKSDLSTLLDSAKPLSPKPRADLLYNSKALERAHSAAASQGQTLAPDAEDNIDLHFVCFVKSEKTGHLWELDGRRKGPIDRGFVGTGEGDDVLCEKALDVGVRRFLKRGEGNLRFSLVTLAPSLD